MASLALMGAADHSATISKILDFPPTTFTIYPPQGQRVVGQGHYELKRLADNKVVIYGENRYRDGEYDIENDVLDLNSAAEWPSMVSFQHDFYNSNGSLKVSGSADVRTGQATCVANESGSERRYTASLAFPSDTYAGAALLVPIQLALAEHKTFPIRMHLFNCAPETHVVALEVHVSPADNHWQFYPDQQLVQAEAEPDFGFWNFLIAPFVSEVYAWFDPANGFRYVGGRIHRYLVGEEQVMLASRKSGSAGKEAER